MTSLSRRTLLLALFLAALLAVCSAPTHGAPLPAAATATATPRLVSSPTRMPTRTPTSAPTPATPQVLPKAKTINVRAGPGTNYDVIGAAAAGTALPIVARLKNSAWYEVVLPNGKHGWVSAAVVTAQGNLAQIPLGKNIPPPPTPRPAPVVSAGGNPPAANAPGFKAPANFGELERSACGGVVLGGDPTVGAASPPKALGCGLVKLPPDILATDRGHLRYTVRRESDGYRELEKCEYSPTGAGQATNWITRRQWWWKLQIIDVRTGAVVADKIFDGLEPGPCPSRQHFGGSSQTMDGPAPLEGNIVPWVRENLR